MPLFTSYAQNFEDVRLWRALRDVENGCYIDIGAQDPIVDSVSRGFYERGWRGLHVEPSPAYAAKLRVDRPDETVIQSAVGARTGLLTFYEFADTGLSTADATVAQRHAKDGRATATIIVPCTTLKHLFESFAAPEIHWLKIDVEGLEREVLRGWTGSTARPWVVVVESTMPMTQIESHTGWERLLIRRGYRFACFDGLNRFYVAHAHRELIDAFAIPPNVFDGFSLSGTSTASFAAVSVAKIQQLEDNVRDLEAARETDATKTKQDLDAARAQLQEFSATLAARERACGELLTSSAARVDELMQRLYDLGKEHTAALDAGTAIRSRLARQLEAAREEVIRLWDASQRKGQLARDALLEKNETAQALAERERRIAALHMINKRQRSYLQNVFASRSWRITAPMRELVQLLRGILHKPLVESLELTWAVDQAGFDAVEENVESAPATPVPMPPATAAVAQEIALRRNLVVQGLAALEADAPCYLPDVSQDL